MYGSKNGFGSQKIQSDNMHGRSSREEVGKHIWLGLRLRSTTVREKERAMMGRDEVDS
jgi:hypothetical protein